MAISRQNIVEAGKSVLQSASSIGRRRVLPVILGLSSMATMATKPFDGPLLQPGKWGDETLGLIMIAAFGIPSILLAIASVTVWKYEPPQGRPIKEKRRK